MQTSEKSKGKNKGNPMAMEKKQERKGGSLEPNKNQGKVNGAKKNKVITGVSPNRTSEKPINNGNGRRR